jgi:hypothetical protein
MRPRLPDEAYLIGCALTGILAAQHEEPDQQWAAEWAIRMGRLVARMARFGPPGSENSTRR